MQYKLYNISGTETSAKLNLNKDVFGIEPNSHCVYLTLKSELASMKFIRDTSTSGVLRGHFYNVEVDVILGKVS